MDREPSQFAQLLTRSRLGNADDVRKLMEATWDEVSRAIQRLKVSMGESS